MNREIHGKYGKKASRLVIIFRNMKEMQDEQWKDLNNLEKSSKSNSEKIWKIRNKSKLNSEKIWQIQKIEKRYEKYG